MQTRSTTAPILILAIMAIILTASALSLDPDDAEAATTAGTGTTGDVTWTLDSSGNLTLSGSGATSAYTEAAPGWSSLGWDGVTSVTVGSGVTTLGSYLFYNCTTLTTVNISNVPEWGSYVFANCSSLSYVSLGGSNHIGSHAFWQCSALKSIDLTNVHSVNDSGLAYSGLTSLTIPETMSFTLDNGHDSSRAFWYLHDLTSVTINSAVAPSLTQAGTATASGVTVKLSDSVTTIAQTFLTGAYLSSLTIPSSVTAIYDQLLSGAKSPTNSINLIFEGSQPTLSGGNFLNAGASPQNNITKLAMNVYSPGNWAESAFSSTNIGNYATVTYHTQAIQYALHFDANGGEGAPSTRYFTTSDSPVTFSEPSTVPTRSGFTFSGWAEPGSSTPVTWPYSMSSDAPTQTLHALWTQITYTYTLRYDANGGTGAPSSNTVRTTSTAYDISVNTGVTPTYAGHEFRGWATSSGGTTAVTLVRLTSSNPIATVYAIWVPTYTYTLSFDANGGTGAPGALSETTTSSSASFTIPATRPALEGSTFIGWASSSTSTVSEYSPGSVVSLEYPVTSLILYAIWVDGEITITLSQTSIDATTGAIVRLTAVIEPAALNGVASWAVDNPTLVTWSSDGNTASIWARVAGAVVVTASYAGLSASCTITITAPNGGGDDPKPTDTDHVDLSFTGIVDFIAEKFFGGSSTLAALALIIVAWIVCAVVCVSFRASPVYSVVPMIPIAILFSAMNLLNTTIAMVLIIVVAVLVAVAFKQVAD